MCTLSQQQAIHHKGATSMTIVRCPSCGLVAAFGTAEQRLSEIQRHRCAQLAHRAFAWSPPTSDGAA